MLRIRNILVVAAVMILLGVFTATAQTKEFKSEWNKIYEYVYFKTDNFDKKTKTPSGQTRVCIFGFKNNREFSPGVEISGNVIYAKKTSKGYLIDFEPGTLSFVADYEEIRYNGSMSLLISDNIMKDNVTISIMPKDGYWGVRNTKDPDNKFTYYHILPVWQAQIGQLRLHVSKPYNNDPTPYYKVDYSDFMLPKFEVRNVEFTREVGEALAENKYKLTREDSVFLHSVLRPGSRIENVPYLQQLVSVMPTKGDTTCIFGREEQYYMLGNVLELSEAIITRDNEDNYIIEHKGIVPKYMFKAKYSNSAFPKFIEASWNDGSKFSDVILTRSDGSRISGIKFEVKSNLLEMPQGFIISQARALGDFTDLDFYDFNKYFKDESLGQLEVGAYIMSDGKTSSLITDGIIDPVRLRVEAEHADEMNKYLNEKNKYDQAKASLEQRQIILQSQYEEFKAPKKVFTLLNSQASTPHNVDVIRQIKRSGDGYEEIFFVTDQIGSTYPLQIDEEGDASYFADGRTFYFTHLTSQADEYLSPYRKALNDKIVIGKGEPQKPSWIK